MTFETSGMAYKDQFTPWQYYSVVFIDLKTVRISERRRIVDVCFDLNVDLEKIMDECKSQIKAAKGKSKWQLNLKK